MLAIIELTQNYYLFRTKFVHQITHSRIDKLKQNQDEMKINETMNKHNIYTDAIKGRNINEKQSETIKM